MAVAEQRWKRDTAGERNMKYSGQHLKRTGEERSSPHALPACGCRWCEADLVFSKKAADQIT